MKFLLVAMQMSLPAGPLSWYAVVCCDALLTVGQDHPDRLGVCFERD